MKKGVLSALVGYTLWGILPIYWKLFQDIPAFEVLCHRIAWSLVFLIALLTWNKKWSWLKEAKNNPKVLISSFLGAILVAINWYAYIWGVNSGFVIETSLGYFINPLVTIFLGMLFLKERLRRGQWASIGLATLGVVYLTFSYGSLPWIGLTLAFSFGFYGLVKKIGTLPSMEGLTAETSLLFLPAVAYLVYLETQGVSAFGHTTLGMDLLLTTAGIVTSIPLLLFAYGAKRVEMSTLGLVQYTAPTIQFLLGLFLYNEPFNLNSLIGYSIVWIAILIYIIEGIISIKVTKLQRS